MKPPIFLLLAIAAAACPQAPGEALPEFEVASVKPINPNVRNIIDIKILPGGRMIASAATLLQLIAGAYGGLETYQVAAPSWTAEDRFNIEAEPPENDFDQQPTVMALGRQVPEKTMLRLRSLLIARFHLKTHFENREHTVYDLTVVKSGSKLVLSDPKNASVGCQGGLRTAIASIEAASCSMPWLARLLARLAFQTAVFDKTGLSGDYDFKFEFTPIGQLAPPGASELDASNSQSIFTSIQSLGLKLEPRKAPVQVVVVDHVDKLSAN